MLIMVFDTIQNSETLLVVAIVVVMVPIIIWMFRSDRPDGHMDFLLGLMERFEKSTDN